MRYSSLHPHGDAGLSIFMKIRLNGEDYEIPGELTLEELLESLSINPGRVAVEVNLQVIKRSQFGTFRIKEGDIVEIVNFVGGGQDGE